MECYGNQVGNPGDWSNRSGPSPQRLARDNDTLLQIKRSGLNLLNC